MPSWAESSDVANYRPWTSSWCSLAHLLRHLRARKRLRTADGRQSRAQGLLGEDAFPGFFHREGVLLGGRTLSNLARRLLRRLDLLPRFFLTFILKLLANFWQTLRGPFSAVSKPNLQVNSKYSFESSWRDLEDLQAFAPLNIRKFQSHISSNFFRIFTILVWKFHRFSKTFSKIHELWWTFSGISSIFHGEDQNLLDWTIDSQIPWDFATEIFDFSEKWFFKT